MERSRRTWSRTGRSRTRSARMRRSAATASARRRLPKSRSEMGGDDVEILRTERDLYARLIELGAHDNLLPLLDEALALVVSLTGAKKGYIAIDARGGPDVVVGCSSEDVKEISAQMSTGIIAEA